MVSPGCRDRCPEPGPEGPATLGLRGPREGARAPGEAGCGGPRAGPSEHSRVDPVAASREVLGPDRRPPLPVAVAVATAVAAAQARFGEVLPLRHSSMAVTGALDSTNQVAMCLGLASRAPSRRWGAP